MTNGVPDSRISQYKCQKCGNEEGVDFILGINQWLCAEDFAELHKREEELKHEQ